MRPSASAGFSLWNAFLVLVSACCRGQARLSFLVDELSILSLLPLIQLAGITGPCRARPIPVPAAAARLIVSHQLTPFLPCRHTVCTDTPSSCTLFTAKYAAPQSDSPAEKSLAVVLNDILINLSAMNNFSSGFPFCIGYKYRAQKYVTSVSRHV